MPNNKKPKNHDTTSNLYAKFVARSDISHGTAETGYQVHRLTEMYHMTSSPPMKVANSVVNSNSRKTTISQPTKPRKRQARLPNQKKLTIATTRITTTSSTRIQKTCNATSSSVQLNRKCAHQRTNSNLLILENYNDRMLAASRQRD